MRSFSGGVCAYGLNSQAGYLFERNQSALRQRSFSRARGFAKRSRDEDNIQDKADNRVLRGFKRMRVSSPINSSTDCDSDMTDEEAVTPRSTWRAGRSLVVKKPILLKTVEPLELSADKLQQLEIPTDESCRAMVVFDPYQSMKISSEPKVELVETESEDEKEFVRFEELPSDNDEPVDMDVD